MRTTSSRACFTIGLIFASSGCLADDIETKNYNSQELGHQEVQIDCSLSSLQNKISELNNLGGNTEFDVMLSFGQRKDGDGMLDIMKKSALRNDFSPEREAAIFVSSDKQIVAVARFNRKANVNLFLKAATACEKSSGQICTPVIYYDGNREYCLLFSSRELMQ